MGELFNNVSRRNSDGTNLNVITNSAEYGLIPQRDFFDKDIAVEGNTKNYYIIKSGDFVYNPRKSTTSPYGPFNCYQGKSEGIVSPLYTCLTPKSTEHTDYLLWYFKSPAWYSYIYHNGAQGGARHDRVGMTNDLMKGIPVSLPCKEEQRKVVEFLSFIDDRISLQHKLVENLKNYKRGVIAAILSRKIRFPDADGKPYPEWTSCLLQDVVDFLDGQRKPLESADRAKRQGQYPYYGASGIIDYIDDYIFNEPMLLLGEDGANIINRSTPLCFIATGKFWVNNHAHVMRPKTGQNIKFLCEILESIDYTRYNTGTAQPKLNQEKCREIELILPVYEEQCRIAKFLSSIDKRIETAQGTLEYLLSNKVGLLQQLFI